jgi:uncharacterized protein (TIGR02271 family)
MYNDPMRNDDLTTTSFDTSDPGVLNSVPVGTTVYDITGDKVGTIAEYDSQTGYMVVEKGWLFHTDLYVPLTLISNTDDQGVYLKVTKDDLKEDQYANPPTGYVNTGTTMMDTSTGYASTTATGTGSTAYDTQGSDAFPGQAQVWDQDSASTTAGYTSQVSDVQDQDLGAGTVVNTPSYTGANSTTIGTDTATDMTGQTASGDIVVPVREEELVAGTRATGEDRVRIHKEVIEEEQTLTVPVRHERVVVERVPASGEEDPNALDANAFKEGDIEIPVREEEVVVGKRVRDVENVRIHKDTVTEEEQVSDTVRKERVRVEGDEQTGRYPR